MKAVAQSLLVLFFVLFFITGLLAATFKFKLLDYNFWQSTFEKHDVYSELANAGKASFESQIDKEGGNKNDVKILTDLITSDNAKDVVNKNLQNFLNFANGNSAQIYVYLPIDKIPANYLPKSITGVKSVMPLEELLTKFNFQDSQNLQLSSVSKLGESTALAVAIASFFVLLTIVSLVLLTAAGKRFLALGVALMLSGIASLILMQAGLGLASGLSGDLLNKPTVSMVFAGIIIPPVITEIVVDWKILGLALIFVGAALFFIKKPGYNTRK